jgi:TolB-like protein
MKNILSAVILGIALSSVSFALTSVEAGAGDRQNGRTKVAVIEFSPEPGASTMTHEAKRQVQASLAFALVESKRFDVVDVRRTRDASQGDLASINVDASTAAAVRVGKQLGVSYVLTGVVKEYTAKMADGYGRLVLKTRLIEVSTGKIKHSGETAQRSTSVMRTTGAAEMQTKAVKPAIEKLVKTLVEPSL